MVDTVGMGLGHLVQWVAGLEQVRSAARIVKGSKKAAKISAGVCTCQTMHS